MNEIVAVSVKESEIGIVMIVVFAISVMDLRYVRCPQTQSDDVVRGLIAALLEAEDVRLNFFPK
jgi:hypothetical protein